MTRIANRPTVLAAAGAVALLSAFVGLLIVDQVHGTLRGPQVETSLLLLGVAFSGWALAVWASERRAVSLAAIWGVAVVARLLMVFTEPSLSDDIFRYLWEGHLVAEGISPYDFTIDDRALDPYAVDVRSSVNNRTLASPYLPVAHVAFAGLDAVVGPSVRGMQVLMVVFELMAAALIGRLLALASLPAHRIMLWLWNPLVIVEVAHAGHLDALLILLALAAVVATWTALGTLDTGQVRQMLMLAAPVALGASVLTRPLALLWFPVLAVRWARWQIAVFAATIVVPIVAVAVGSNSGLALGSDQPTGVFGSSGVYTRTFRFNAAIATRIEQWVGEDALIPAIGAIAGVATLVAAAVAWRTTDIRTSLRLLAVPAGVYALLTPVLHPWYLLFVLSVVAFLAPGSDEVRTASRRWLTAAPWLTLCVLVSLSYLTYRDPSQFGELRWVRHAIWWPTVIATIVAVAAVVTLAVGGSGSTVTGSVKRLRPD